MTGLEQDMRARLLARAIAARVATLAVQDPRVTPVGVSFAVPAASPAAAEAAARVVATAQGWANAYIAPVLHVESLEDGRYEVVLQSGTHEGAWS